MHLAYLHSNIYTDKKKQFIEQVSVTDGPQNFSWSYKNQNTA